MLRGRLAIQNSFKGNTKLPVDHLRRGAMRRQGAARPQRGGLISLLDLPAILLDGRSPTSPLPNANIREKEKDRDYFGSLSPDKMQPPLPCIRCYQQAASKIGGFP